MNNNVTHTYIEKSKVLINYSKKFHIVVKFLLEYNYNTYIYNNFV